MYVYRDTGEPPDSPATAAPGQQPDERDASYWYDLSGGDSAPVQAETRGPFEPLVSSSGPPPVDSHDEQETVLHARTGKLEQIKDFYLTAEAIGEQNVDKHFDQLLAQQRELISEYFKQSPTARPGDGRGPQAGFPEAPAESRASAHAQAGADPAAALTPDGQDGPGGPGGAGGPGDAGDADVPYGASAVAEQPRVW